MLHHLIPNRASPCLALALWVAASASAQAVVYRCPGNPVLYTDALSAKEAQERGCKVIDGTPISIIQSAPPGRKSDEGSRPPSSRPRVDASEQRARDLDRRAILQAELSREEAALRSLQAELGNGEPERRGDERNYQRYLERVAALRAGVARKEADIAALKREMAKLPAP
jgi:hypothetical protein